MSYHPDSAINDGIKLDALAAELADLAAGYDSRWWVCPSCGSSHNRGFFLSLGAHRCLHCGYVGGDGTTHTNRPTSESE